jgi:hypothetical protein
LSAIFAPQSLPAAQKENTPRELQLERERGERQIGRDGPEIDIRMEM